MNELDTVPLNTYVLVWLDRGRWMVAKLSPSTKRKGTTWYADTLSGMLPRESVKGWLPLPPAPNGDTE